MAAILGFIRDGDWLTLRRVRVAAVIFAVAVAAIFAASTAPYFMHGIVLENGESLGRDFMNYWTAARLAVHGHAADIYDINRFDAWQRDLMAPNVATRWYGYPPVNILLTLPLGPLNFVPAWALWLAAGTAFAAWVLATRIGWGWALAAIMASPAFLQNAIAGQNGAITAALMGGGIALLEKRPRLAGMLFGLLCYKPHLAILVPVALIAARQWRAFIAAAITVLVLVAASGFLFGWGVWPAFLNEMAVHRTLLENRFGMWPRMPSIYLAARWLDAANPLAYAIQGLFTVLAAAVTCAIWRGPGTMAIKGAALMLCAFLATPYAWDYDMVMLSIAGVWYAQDASRTGWLACEKMALVLLVLAPAVTPLLAFWVHLQLGPLVLCLVLGLVMRRLWLPEAVGKPSK